MRIRSRVKHRRHRASPDVHPARANRVLNATKLSASMRGVFTRSARSHDARDVRIARRLEPSSETPEKDRAGRARRVQRERDEEDREDGETKWVYDFHRREVDDAGP